MPRIAGFFVLSFNGSGGSPSGVNARDELNDERVNHRSLPDERESTEKVRK